MPCQCPRVSKADEQSVYVYLDKHNPAWQLHRCHAEICTAQRPVDRQAEGMRGVLRPPVYVVVLGFSAPVQVSTVLGAALEEQRKEGEYIEGIAIWVAVAIVIMVGEFP